MKAILLGATGLVGSELLRILLEDPEVSEVVCLSRRALKLGDGKIKQHVIDFEQPKTWPDISADVLFSAFGTRLKEVGSKDAQFKIDYTYQLTVAEWAAARGVPCYVLVSSAGVNANSLFFYPRIRGQLEEAVKKLPFRTVAILRPSLLMGHREKPRINEEMAGTVLTAVGRFIPGSQGFLPIQAERVAHQMLAAAKEASAGIRIYTSRDMQRLSLPPQR